MIASRAWSFLVTIQIARNRLFLDVRGLGVLAASRIICAALGCTADQLQTRQAAGETQP
jgi:hypothetical protein